MHQNAQPGDEEDGRVARELPDQRACHITDGKSDERHPCLERGQHETDAQAVARWQTGDAERRGDGEGVQPERKHQSDKGQVGDHGRQVTPPSGGPNNEPTAGLWSPSRHCA